jgi:hypothetical protein
MLYVLSIAAFFVGGVLTLANWVYVFQSFYYKENHSKVPFVGGVSACLGCLLWPSGSLRSFWWIPLLVDIGCIPLLLGLAIQFVVWLIRRRGK